MAPVGTDYAETLNSSFNVKGEGHNRFHFGTSYSLHLAKSAQTLPPPPSSHKKTACRQTKGCTDTITEVKGNSQSKAYF